MRQTAPSEIRLRQLHKHLRECTTLLEGERIMREARTLAHEGRLSKAHHAQLRVLFRKDQTWMKR
jgi:hypothetical protein